MPFDPASAENAASPCSTPVTPREMTSVRTIPSESLLQGGTEVLITHGAELYRLRLTRNGKLILQK
jgi:hemin uptake protein HemP